MSVRFARLRIAGFKSFAEAASVEILPGLTGIVGPNGCGKSNVVEALRWAMGESSARSLRGGEMDDLIFAGTAARPARNLAEVTLTLEDAAGIAPPPFHDQPELQISRRIERGSGSFYRVNGREARARDVQTLFADLASGARSSAMVSQGRVAAIVNARPEERRSILEEAAGITGLHARRHEAELKLRAAEANLARAEDLRLQLETRLGELGTQARQASRYREIAAGLREAEAGLLALLHARARAAVRQAHEAAMATEAALRAAERRANDATVAEQQAEAALPGPREAEAIARTALERHRIAAETLARDEERAAADAAEARSRLDQSRTDAAEAQARLEDATAALTRIEADREAAKERSMALPTRLLDAEQALQAAQAQLADATALLSHATAQETAIQNRADQIARDQQAATQRLARLENQLAGLRAEHEAAHADLPDDGLLASLQAACDSAAAALGAARIRSEQSGEDRIQAARDADTARAAAVEAKRKGDTAQGYLDEAMQRASSLAQERRTIESHSLDAERGLVPGAALLASRDESLRRADTLAAARQALEAAEMARNAAQQAHAQARQRMADAERRRQQVDAARKSAEAALSRANVQHEQLSLDAAAARAALVPDAMLRAENEQLRAAETTLAEAQDALACSDAARLEAERFAAAQGAALAEAIAEQARIEAEADGLSRAIGSDADAPAGTHWPSLAEILSVPAGLESALAAVLAEGLDAAVDEGSPRHWRDLPALPEAALPQGVIALSGLVAAPAALARILSHAGLVENPSDGAALHERLAPGQCLVSRDGALWRWDGYHLSAGLPGDSAAARGAVALAQRNRLREARLQFEHAALRSAALRECAAASAEAHAVQVAHAASARVQRDAAERTLGQIRERVAHLSARAGAATARLEAIVPQHERAMQVRDEAAHAADEAKAQDAALPALQELRQTLDRARAAEAVGLEAETAARRARQEAESQLEAARREQAALQARHGEAESRLAALVPQRARLAQECSAAEADVEAARAALETLPPVCLAQNALDHALALAGAAEVHEIACRAARREAEVQRDDAQAAHAEALSRLERQRSRIDALTPRLSVLEEERREAAALLDVLLAEAAGLADPGVAAGATAQARAALIQSREHEALCRDARAHCVSEAASLKAAQESLAGAHADWSRRATLARGGHDAALARLAADMAVHDTLCVAPLQAEQRRREHSGSLGRAEQAHAEAEATLRDAAEALGHAQSERRQADIAMSEAREAKLRLQGRAEQADAILAQLLAETPNPPQTVPDDLSESAEASLRRRVARLTREREEMGPVNLRADIESQEAQARADAIAREREELEAAIARLRGSIGHLNREGRERLLAVFENVDRHFQSLFARMFSGGRAHLGMVGDDDPLAAGLEIYAQPPGKKLATLSLLSGGEQALTALSLIFAVFRCNPAPVCVLDEVDAPLDDANVGRFCALLADMVEEAGTRFLVVTHHQLTMAHMDRLYGVTMQERGVSRLLSVDLAAAAGMVTSEKARQLAQ